MESLTGEEENIVYGGVDDLRNETFHKNLPATLRVEFPDGTIISEAKAADTLKNTINRIGPELVEILCFSEPILRPCNVELVSRTKASDERYQSCMHHLNNGYFLFTKTNTVVKNVSLNL